MKSASRHYYPSAPIASVSLGSAIGLSVAPSTNLSLQVFGHTISPDFVAYFTSFLQFSSGGNPYDVDALGALQHKLHGYTPRGVLPLWYPPWALVLFWPILAHSWHVSLALWLSLSTFCAFFTVRCCYNLLDISFEDSAHHRAYLAWIIFPVVAVLYFAQVGLFLTAALSAFLVLQKQRRDVLAGMVLVMLSVKSHLFLPLTPLLVAWIVNQRRYMIALVSVITLAALTCLAELQAPGCMRDWIHISKIPLLQMKTATLAGLCGDVLSIAIGDDPRLGPLIILPIFLIPLFGFLGSLFLAIKNRNEILPERSIHQVVCLSVFLAPYAWIHDYALLLIPYTMLLANERQRVWGNSATRVSIAAQIAAFLGAPLWLAHPVTFCWYPCVILFAVRRANF
ncbi:MAG: DUF2029 domain-containing protein [Bdellovibrionales bacterium]|nr:DUF2029 domain-containing protein [Bdellovibrionales bacterium]